jgi:hypothetical protein
MKVKDTFYSRHWIRGAAMTQVARQFTLVGLGADIGYHVGPKVRLPDTCRSLHACRLSGMAGGRPRRPTFQWLVPPQSCPSSAKTAMARRTAGYGCAALLNVGFGEYRHRPVLACPSGLMSESGPSSMPDFPSAAFGAHREPRLPAGSWCSRPSVVGAPVPSPLGVPGVWLSGREYRHQAPAVQAFASSVGL